MRETIAAELALAAAILVVTASLGTTPPPRVALGVQSPPADVHSAHEHHARALSVEMANAGRRATIIFSSGESGPNAVDIEITDENGDALDARAGMDEHDLHFNDLRGTAATKFYLAGLKIRAIAEIMAWEEDYVEKIIRRYVSRTAYTKELIRQLNEPEREQILENR